MSELPPEKTVRLKSLLIAVLVLLLLATGTVWLSSDAIRARWCGDPARPPAAVETTAPPASGLRQVDEAVSGPREARAAAWEQRLGAPPAWPDPSSAVDCGQVADDLERVCAASRDPEACRTLPQVAEMLAARPPDTAAELKQLGVLLANAFHLYRTLGRQRLERLRDALDADPELREPAALAMYRWLASRPACDPSSAVRPERLAAYAAFVERSLGGQAYLRRRSPDVEALAGFYAALIADRAQQAGANPEGLDPRVRLSRTRQLIASQPLVFRDRYLEQLTELEARYAR